MAVARRVPLLLEITPTAAGAGNTDTVILRGGAVIDIWNIASVTDGGGGTMQFLRQALGSGAFNAMQTAINMNTLNALTRTATVNIAERTLTATDVVRLTLAVGTTNTGFAYLEYYPTAVPPLPTNGG